MNASFARAELHGKSFLALYSPSWTSKTQVVTDEHGEPVPYPTADKALIAAQQALLAALEPPIRAQRYDPRITVDRKPWQVIRPRSRAGRKALFQSIFKPEMAEA